MIIACESDPMGCLGFDIKLDECSTHIEANYTSVPGTSPHYSTLISHMIKAMVAAGKFPVFEVKNLE